MNELIWRYVLICINTKIHSKITVEYENFKILNYENVVYANMSVKIELIFILSQWFYFVDFKKKWIYTIDNFFFCCWSIFMNKLFP